MKSIRLTGSFTIPRLAYLVATQINYRYLQVLHIAIRIRVKVYKFLGSRTIQSYSSIDNTLLVYLNICPGDKWVLNSIFDKVIAEYDRASRTESIKLSSLKDLVVFSANNPGKILYLFTHYKELIPAIRLLRTNNIRIVTYFTHSVFLQPKTISNLNSCHAVLCMNSIEAARLKSLGVVSKKLRVLPGGTSKNECISVFKSSKQKEKDIDVIFGMKYTGKSSYDRKNYSMIIDLVVKLCSLGRVVCVSGPGWREYFDESKVFSGYSNLIIDSNDNRAESLELYKRSKVFINLSLLEGGPMPLLDSFICNCICLSTPTGFVFELFRENQERLYIIRSSDSVHRVLSTVQYILETKSTTAPLCLKDVPQEFYYETISCYLLNTVSGYHS